MSDQTRKGCQDIWNAFMVTGARFTDHDIPFCPTTATEVPKDIVTWTEAKTIYKKALRQKDPGFSHPAFTISINEANNLVATYSGKGEPLGDSKERVDFGRIIGN